MQCLALLSLRVRTAGFRQMNESGMLAFSIFGFHASSCRRHAVKQCQKRERKKMNTRWRINQSAPRIAKDDRNNNIDTNRTVADMRLLNHYLVVCIDHC